MSQMQGLIGIWRRILDHYFFAIWFKYGKIIRKYFVIKFIEPVSIRQRDIQETLDHIKASDFLYLIFQEFPYFRTGLLRRFTGNFGDRESNYGNLSFKFFAGGLQINVGSIHISL